MNHIPTARSHPKLSADELKLARLEWRAALAPDLTQVRAADRPDLLEPARYIVTIRDVEIVGNWLYSAAWYLLVGAQAAAVPELVDS